MLTKEQIASHVDLGVEVEVPEWGGTVRLRGLSVAEWLGFRKEQDADGDGMSAIVVRCLIDDKGNRLFTDEEAPVIARQNAVVVARLAVKAQELSGATLTQEQQEKN